jgi:hypothetical protein
LEEEAANMRVFRFESVEQTINCVPGRFRLLPYSLRLRPNPLLVDRSDQGRKLCCLNMDIPSTAAPVEFTIDGIKIELVILQMGKEPPELDKGIDRVPRSRIIIDRLGSHALALPQRKRRLGRCNGAGRISAQSVRRFSQRPLALLCCHPDTRPAEFSSK